MGRRIRLYIEVKAFVLYLGRKKKRKDVRINIDAVHLYGENSQDGCDGYEEYRIQCFLYET